MILKIKSYEIIGSISFFFTVIGTCMFALAWFSGCYYLAFFSYEEFMKALKSEVIGGMIIAAGNFGLAFITYKAYQAAYYYHDDNKKQRIKDKLQKLMR